MMSPLSLASSSQPKSQTQNPKLMALAEDFESNFLASMFGQMTSLLNGDGPLGGQGAGGDAWRGLLTDELAKSVSRSGGVGIARSVYAALI
ncbi:MAG: rod-binding protein, partial [Hyphomicrobiales bacterium]